MTTQLPELPPVNTLGYTFQTFGPGKAFWLSSEFDESPELYWPKSTYIFDKMRRTDSQVASVIRAVVLPILRTKWYVVQNGARDEVTEHIAKDLRLPIQGSEEPEKVPRRRNTFSWQEHLRHAMIMLPIGHSFFEQQYELQGTTLSDVAWHLRKLEWRPHKSISAIKVAKDGGLESIRQHDIDADIGVNRLVAYVNSREGGNWLGQSLLRPAYKHWLIKDRLLRVDAQTIERNGMGVPRYKGYPGEGDDDPGFSRGLGIATSWRSGEAAGAAIDNGAELDLIGVEGTLPQALPSIQYHDEQIARSVLAHFLNLGTQTGSWALGTTFADFFTLSLQSIAEYVADVATAHIVEDIVDANWGPDEQAPMIGFEEIGSRQLVTAQALQALISAGAITMDPALEAALRETYGLPPKDPNAPPPQPKLPPVPDPNADPSGQGALDL